MTERTTTQIIDFFALETKSLGGSFQLPFEIKRRETSYMVAQK
jgi:hypothetical protein